MYPKVSGLSHNEINNNKKQHKGLWRKTTRLTHKIAIQLHLVAESCTICSSHSGWPVRKLLDTSAYLHINFHIPRLPIKLWSYMYVSCSTMLFHILTNDYINNCILPYDI